MQVSYELTILFFAKVKGKCQYESVFLPKICVGPVSGGPALHEICVGLVPHGSGAYESSCEASRRGLV